MSDLLQSKQSSGRSRSRLGIHLAWILVAINVMTILALIVVGYSFSAGQDGRIPQLDIAYIAAMIAVAAQLVILGLNQGIRAVARQTLAQCLRMKIAVVFIALLVLMLLLVSTQMKGDGTLAGLIRTFLSYSTGIMGIILSVVTILIGASLVSNDIQKKTIFSVTTKPVARWQYIVGRWLGLVAMSGALLLVSAGVIYVVSQQMRSQGEVSGQEVTPIDRLAVESEVFAARSRVAPEPLRDRVDAEIKQRVAKLMADGTTFERTLNDWRMKTNGSDEAALAGIEQEIRRQVETSAQTAQAMVNADRDENPSAGGNGGAGIAPTTLRWAFTGILRGGNDITGRATVMDKQQVPGVKGAKGETVWRVRLKAPRELLGQLVYAGPVRASNLDGMVFMITPEWFAAEIVRNGASAPILDQLNEGSEVRLTIEPTVQLTFRATPVDGAIDSISGFWTATNPETGMGFPFYRQVAPKVQSTITVSAKAISADGRMFVEFVNMTGSAVTILEKDVGVLYRTGGFEGNFVRAMSLIFLQLVFLAAIGVFTGSFLSFPVACLVSFAVLPFSYARGFLTEATLPQAAGGDSPETWLTLGRYVLKVMELVLPDLARTSPSDSLVAGTNLSWGFVGETTFLQVAVRTLLVLAIACWFFHKRELARVQV